MLRLIWFDGNERELQKVLDSYLLNTAKNAP